MPTSARADEGIGPYGCILQNIFSLTGLQIPPYGGHIPQILDHLGNDLQNMVDLFLRVVFAEAQTQAAVGHVMNPADGQQHMAGPYNSY